MGIFASMNQAIEEDVARQVAKVKGFELEIKHRGEKSETSEKKKIVVDENNLSGLDNVLKGDTAIAISYDEPVAPAKILKKFIKDNDLLVIKGIIIDGKVMKAEMFEKLSKMKSKEEMLGQLVSMLSNPLQKLVSTLNSPLQNTLGVLANLKNKS